MINLENLSVLIAVRRMSGAVKLLEEIVYGNIKKDCQAYIDGKIKTQAEIARKHGVTRACISKKIKEMKFKPLSPEDLEWFVESHRKTCALRQRLVAQTKKQRFENIEKETKKLWRTLETHQP